ncbi:hypothetical protein ACA910_010782 [Epithemia clementina (nom. ined.)]
MRRVSMNQVVLATCLLYFSALLRRETDAFSATTPTVLVNRYHVKFSRRIYHAGQTNRIGGVRRNVGSESLNEAAADVRCRIGLEEAFDRWRYLQKLLDAETDPDDTNRVLFHVLQGYYLKIENDPLKNEEKPIASPERTSQRVKMVENVLSQAMDRSSIAALSRRDTNNKNADILAMLKQLLPDPVDEEDDYKSIWDTIMEIHGREAVKIDERNGEPEWKARCLVAQVLLHYDFLQKGL